MDKSYSISVISKACNTPTQTLRAWESRYNAFKPLRDDKGNRLYSHNDYQRALLLSKLILAGHKISKIAQLPLKDLESAQDHSTKPINRNSALEVISTLIEKYQVDLIVDELNLSRSRMSVLDYILELIVPMIAKAGEMVQKGKYTISQEHLISSLIREQLSQITIPTSSRAVEEMIFATPEGNIHELSIQIASLIAKANEVKTRFLGAGHPASSLSTAINSLNCPTVVLGVISSEQWVFKDQIIPYLSQIDKGLNKEIRIILGGANKISLPKFKMIKEIKFMKSFKEFENLTRKKL